MHAGGGRAKGRKPRVEIGDLAPGNDRQCATGQPVQCLQAGQHRALYPGLGRILDDLRQRAVEIEEEGRFTNREIFRRARQESVVFDGKPR